MKGLQFQRLVLLSDSKKLANQFTFPKRFNLVTGKDNSIGKSTLVKCLFWAIGCDPKFDEEWKSNDVKAILYFKINQKEFVVSRYADGIYFGLKNGPIKKYTKITGEFSQDFTEKVGFNLMLANRTDGLDIPPPAFYFLPFYIDQKKSWDEPWNGFEGLAQYSNFKSTLIKYFCGYLSSAHFELEEELFEHKAIEKEASQQVERIAETISVLQEMAPEQNIAVTLVEFEFIQQEIEKELVEFSTQQSRLFEQQSMLANEIHDLEQQHLIASASAKELDEDYTFAVENVASDSLKCPLCGIEHDNSLLSRAGLLTDQEALKQQASRIKTALKDKYRQRAELKDELNIVAAEIDRINEKYLKEDNSEDKSNNQQVFEQALHAVSQKRVNSNVIQKKESFQAQSQHAKDKQKDIKKQQRKLLKKEDKDTLNELFIGNLCENIQTLSATGVNLNGVKSPMDYKKILGGGAAEGTRGTLAYHLAILRQIAHVNHCQIAPFVIDTPNQQEQAKQRYEQVIDVVTENIPSGHQVILCAMDNNEALSKYKQDAHIIELDGNRLLHRGHYKELRAEYEKVVLASTANI
jgi:phage gp36-like protein